MSGPQWDQRKHRLHLLRHAKSDWGDDRLPDEQRRLAPRGEQAARALARHLSEVGFGVDLVLCSSAVRAVQTWDGVRAGVAGEPEVRVEPAIYGASVEALLDLVRGVAETVGAVLLVGHNPGFEMLATTLAGAGSEDARARLREGYPTAGFASFRLDRPWAAIARGTGYLDAFVRPRDLDD